MTCFPGDLQQRAWNIESSNRQDLFQPTTLHNYLAKRGKNMQKQRYSFHCIICTFLVLQPWIFFLKNKKQPIWEHKLLFWTNSKFKLHHRTLKIWICVRQKFKGTCWDWWQPYLKKCLAKHNSLLIVQTINTTCFPGPSRHFWHAWSTQTLNKYSYQCVRESFHKNKCSNKTSSLLLHDSASIHKNFRCSQFLAQSCQREGCITRAYFKRNCSLRVVTKTKGL